MSYYYRQKRTPPPKQQASPRYVLHNAGLHDESQPFYSGDLGQTKGHHRPAVRLERLQVGIDEMESYADIDGNGNTWPPRTPRSVYRYNASANANVRAVGAVLALTVWIGGAWVSTWWSDTQNDWTYTAQFRTFSIDEAVGHNHDSANHPSHFIVQNDRRHIIIIELPTDDWSKAIIYSAPTLIGDGQEKTPATISFQVSLQTGRLDMVLHVEDQTYLFPNNGTKFITPSGQ